MVPEVAAILPQLIATCRRHGVSRMWLFGSATGRGDRPFTATSDIDLLVEFDESVVEDRGWSHPLFKLPAILSPVAGRPVQLTQNLPFRNPHFRDEVLSTRELVYDGSIQNSLVGRA